MKKQKPMSVDEYRLEMSKSQNESRSLETARLFAFQIKARRLPTPQWKENGGEVRFASDRPDIPRQSAKKSDRAPQWAFDFAWPEHRIAVEIEGIIVYRDKATGQMVTRGGHTTPQGFNDDCEKYAWAAVLGWRLVRFTPRQVELGFAVDMLVRLFAAVEDPVRVEVPRHYFPTDPGVGFKGPSIGELVCQTDELKFGAEDPQR